MNLNFKQSIKLLTLVLVVLGTVTFLIPKTLAAGFRIDVGEINWEINLDGIYKKDSKINCSDIQVGNIPDNGFLVKNSSGTKLFLVDEDKIYVSAKSSFSSLEYSSSISNSFIIKDSDNNILIYVDDNGLHYREDMCVIEEVVECGNGISEAGEECDDGNSSNNDSCLNTCEIASCDDGYILNGYECICNLDWDESCSYCSFSCEIITKTDCTCLSGDIQYPEECEWAINPSTDPPTYYNNITCLGNEECSAYCRCYTPGIGEEPETPGLPPIVPK